jgi:hypothetical protein
MVGRPHGGNLEQRTSVRTDVPRTPARSAPGQRRRVHERCGGSAPRRSLGAVVLLGGAGALLYRGLKGQCALYQAMGVSTVAHDSPSASPRSVAAPDEQPRIVLAGS